MLLNGLRDHHDHFRETSNYSIIASFKDHQNTRNKDDRVYDPEILKMVDHMGARFEYTMLPKKMAYLKIVAIGQNVDGQAESKRMRSAIT